MSRKVCLFVGCFTLLFILWECISSLFPHLLFVLPAPSKVFQTLWMMRDRFIFHTVVTLKEMCGGFLLALLAAFPLAWIMLNFKTTRTFLQPLFIIIQCLPMFTLAPIMVIWFGWTYTAIVIPTALMIFFPLTLNVYQGLRSTSEELLEFFQANQATSWQIFFKLRLPSAIPHIFAGFRISSALAGVGAVAGEWAGAQHGLGILMLESRRNTDLEITFGALFCLTLISTLLYGLILYCEKIALPPRHWKLPFKNLFPSRIRTGKKRFALPFFLFALICLCLFGCQKNSTDHKTRLLLDWLPNPNHIPLYVGIEKGYFEEEGIEIELQKMHDGGCGISYLVADKADLLLNHLPGTIRACSHGAKLKIVGVLVKEPLSGLIYIEDPSIHQPQDLSGKRLGYCLGTQDTTFLDYLLEQSEIVPSERKNVSVDLISAMATHNVDFIFGGFWNIEPALLETLGVKTKTFKTQALGVPSYYEMIILANQDSPYANQKFIAPFQRALQKSLDFCKKYPDDAFSCFLAHNPDRQPKTNKWQKKAWASTLPLLANDQIIDPEEIEKFYQWQLSLKLIKKPFDFQTLIPTQSFL